MASFYNNYYRYYRPYPPVNFKNSLDTKSHSSFEDKSLNHGTSPVESNDKTSQEKSSTKEKKSSRSYSFGPIHFKNPFFDDIESPIFEIMGIQLYLDDIIILGLLFFLYQEGVQDEMLYIALILLLLS